MKQFLKTAPWKRLIYAVWLPVYIAAYFLIEKLVPADGNVVWYTEFAFERLIPFIPVFIVPYLSWFALIFGTGFNLWYFQEAAFKRYMLLLCLSFYACAAFWLIVPNGCRLRVYSEGRDVFSAVVRLIQSLDTPTNVFPSEHVIGTLAALFALIDCGYAFSHKTHFGIMCVWGALIIVSTVFTKQHALIDIPGGALTACAFALLVYRRQIFGKSRHLRTKKR